MVALCLIITTLGANVSPRFKFRPVFLIDGSRSPKTINRVLSPVLRYQDRGFLCEHIVRRNCDVSPRRDHSSRLFSLWGPYGFSFLIQILSGGILEGIALIFVFTFNFT